MSTVDRRLAVAGVLVVLAAAGCGEQHTAADWTRTTSSPTAVATQDPSAVGSPVASPASSASTSPSASALAVSTASAAAASRQQPPASDVQSVLADLNYDVKITGTWDAQTADAVERFQAKHSLPATGIVDDRTQQELLAVAATFSPTPTTDADGLVFDGVWWSSGSLYRSKQRECVVQEKGWQQAIVEGRKSSSVAFHDKAAELGCAPDTWTPDGVTHERVKESHTDGEACTQAQEGTVATGTYPWAICNQVTEGHWIWKVMAS